MAVIRLSSLLSLQLNTAAAACSQVGTRCAASVQVVLDVVTVGVDFNFPDCLLAVCVSSRAGVLLSIVASDNSSLLLALLLETTSAASSRAEVFVFTILRISASAAAGVLSTLCLCVRKRAASSLVP